MGDTYAETVIYADTADEKVSKERNTIEIGWLTEYILIVFILYYTYYGIYFNYLRFVW